METFSALLAICAGNSPVTVNSPHKGQWRGALMFSLICAWINGWVNNRQACDLRRHRAHYDVIVMKFCQRQCNWNYELYAPNLITTIQNVTGFDILRNISRVWYNKDIPHYHTIFLKLTVPLVRHWGIWLDKSMKKYKDSLVWSLDVSFIIKPIKWSDKQ